MAEEVKNFYETLYLICTDPKILLLVTVVTVILVKIQPW